VRRVARRLGLTRETDPEKIERDLQALLGPAEWTPFSMRLILHGRTVCVARQPRCEACELSADCPRIGVANVSRGVSRERIGAKKPKVGVRKNRV
jgi:endonuclease III